MQSYENNFRIKSVYEEKATSLKAHRFTWRLKKISRILHTMQRYENNFKTKRLLPLFCSQKSVGCIIGQWWKRAIQGNPLDWNG